MSAHTPGPWVAEFREAGGYDCMTDAFTVRAAIGNQLVAAVDLSSYGQRPGRDAAVKRHEANANARLIAAAPELLAACKAFLTKPDSDEAVDIDRDYTDTDAAIDQIRAAVAKAEAAA